MLPIVNFGKFSATGILFEWDWSLQDFYLVRKLCDKLKEQFNMDCQWRMRGCTIWMRLTGKTVNLNSCWPLIKMNVLFMLSRCHVTTYSIHQEKQIPEKFCACLNLWPWRQDIMASLHKHKMAACDSILVALISTHYTQLSPDNVTPGLFAHPTLFAQSPCT